MSLSKRDFQGIAQALARANIQLADEGLCQAEGYVQDVMGNLALDIADLCAKHNERFNRARFLDACQPGNVSSPSRKKVA